MTKEEFFRKIDLCQLDGSLLTTNSVDDGYGIRQVYYRWEVYYRERGKENEVIGFPSESDAYDYLLKKLMKFC